jgi:maltoporin
MRQCVYRPANPDYCRIGARGIGIGPEFAEFWDYADLIETHLGPRPGPGNIWKLARKDQNKDFTISNMEWSSSIQVGRRLSYVKYLTYNKKRQTVREWSEETGINFNTLVSRVERGWTPEQILGHEIGPRQELIENNKRKRQQ